MKKPKLEIPKAIHHSHQYQQQDLGDTISLFAGKGPGGRKTIGEIWNAEDFGFPEQTEEIEEKATAIADKIVRSYNAYDDLLEAIKRIVPPTCPIVTHHRPGCDWCHALQIIAKAEEKTQ